jgi:Questin oxidase-like
MRHATLHRLLDRNLQLPAEYGDGLTSHLPMALHALARLGADDARLQRFFDTYAARFASRERHPNAAPVLADWPPHRGRYAALSALQATFTQALERDDTATVLRRVVPQLMSGVGAAAFHGLLRTAHAFEAGHAGELAHALAYWAARWMPLEPVPTDADGLEVEDWAKRLAREAIDWHPSGTLIATRMQDAQRAPAYRALSGRLRFGDDTLARLAGLAAGLYAETGNFTVLHLVTGCRALRVMLPFVGEPAEAQAAVSRAVTAAFLASGAAWAHRSAPPALLDAPALAAAAIASDDDHVIKLVDACLDESALYGDPRHRQAAARALQSRTN